MGEGLNPLPTLGTPVYAGAVPWIHVYVITTSLTKSSQELSASEADKGAE